MNRLTVIKAIAKHYPHRAQVIRQFHVEIFYAIPFSKEKYVVTSRTSV